MCTEKQGSKEKVTSVNQPGQGEIDTHDGKDAHWRGAAQDFDTENVRDAARKDNEQVKKSSQVQSSTSSSPKSLSDEGKFSSKK
jgi:hypothetical protein